MGMRVRAEEEFVHRKIKKAILQRLNKWGMQAIDHRTMAHFVMLAAREACQEFCKDEILEWAKYDAEPIAGVAFTEHCEEEIRAGRTPPICTEEVQQEWIDRYTAIEVEKAEKELAQL